MVLKFSETRKAEQSYYNNKNYNNKNVLVFSFPKILNPLFKLRSLYPKFSCLIFQCVHSCDADQVQGNILTTVLA